MTAASTSYLEIIFFVFKQRVPPENVVLRSSGHTHWIVLGHFECMMPTITTISLCVCQSVCQLLLLVFTTVVNKQIYYSMTNWINETICIKPKRRDNIICAV